MESSTTRILLVDDFAPWRRQICSMLEEQSEFQVIDEVSDGLAAVLKAQELQPDLILLDIELPLLNGIEAARRIRNVSPKSSILFVSQDSSAEVVLEAFSTGAHGYLLKLDAGEQLLTAMKTVMRGEKFLSERLKRSSMQ